MFKKPTVLIIGAGASNELGLPLGSELKAKIRATTEHGNAEHVALSKLLHELFSDAPKYIASGNELSKILGPVPFSSIDEALAHIATSNPDAVTVGKLEIVRQILVAERASGAQNVRADPAQGSWLPRLYSLAIQDTTTENIHEAFDRVTIINFNYDRVIEAYLEAALQAFNNVDQKRAREIVATVTKNTIRPYGCIGPLEWNEGGVAFGAHKDGDLPELAKRIKTFSEERPPAELVEKIQIALNEARVIFVLGFGYHAPNMKLLTATTSEPRKIFATLYNMGGSVGEIKEYIRSHFNSQTAVREYTSKAEGLFGHLWPEIRLAID